LFYARDRIAVFGDSITAGLPNRWYDPLKAACDAFYGNLYGANDPRVPQWFNLGVVSDTVALMDARTGQVDNLCPTVLIIQGVINDCSGATANGAFTTSCTSILTKARTKWPRLRMGWMGPLLWQEDWPSGANPFDTVATGIEAKDAILASLVPTFAAEYINLRSTYTAQMPGLNPGHLQQGIWTLDKVHPNLTGQAVFSSIVQARVQFQQQDFPIARPWLGTTS
jgi:lysophospholipase L1-like esterase